MIRGQRKKIRLTGYDYSQAGAYFVTICTQERAQIFWQPEPYVGQGLCPCLLPPNIPLSPLGQIVQQELERLPERFPSIVLDKYVVMPNHLHAILIFAGPCPGNGQPEPINARQGQSPCPTLGAVIGAYKSISTKQINQYWNTPGQKIWQFRYHDHIIRNDADYLRIWEYIDTNPAKWQEDCYYEHKERSPSP